MRFRSEPSWELVGHSCYLINEVPETREFEWQAGLSHGTSFQQ